MKISRRTFLSSSVAAIATGLAYSYAAEAAPPAGAHLRRDVNRLSPNAPELLSYKRAVDLMMALPDNDPLSWKSQAQIHLNHCPHSNWWFLPWHRAYLFYFETACQKVLGEPAFRIPYWDWSNNRKIPAPFWDAGSHLSHGRDVTPNDQLADEAVGSAIMDQILTTNVDILLFSGATTSDTQRESAISGALESTPHNGVHIFIGQDMGSWLSPLDPIFWLHHANVDRLWASWARLHANRSPAESLWRNHRLESFHDPAAGPGGGAVAPLAHETLDAAAFSAIYDRYETPRLAPTPATAPGLALLRNLRLGSMEQNIGLRASAIFEGSVAQSRIGSVSVPVGMNFSQSASLAISSLSTEVSSPQDAAVLLIVEGVERQGAGISMRVFVNCKDPSVFTPTNDPSYVGTINFFGDDHVHADGQEDHPHDDMSSGRTYAFDCTRTLANLRKAGDYTEGTSLDVSLVAVNLKDPEKLNPGAVVKPGKVSFVSVSS
jgi:tyrosinase